MSTDLANPPSRLLAAVPDMSAFDPVQKEYLSGILAGLATRQAAPFVGLSGNLYTSEPGNGPNLAEEKEEPSFHGTPVSELCRQEVWKYTEHGLDGWERLVAHASEGRMPDDEHTFRFRFFGLFNVSPVQQSLMLRCRIPAGELTSTQFRGLAEMADQFADGSAAITTRSNIQLRQIQPRDALDVLMRLSSLGLTSRGSGVDNVRNITASPTAGIDPQELLDTRPYAHALHHLILNSRDLFDLPRKFNVSFEGGGIIDTVADTNDIGFMAVRVPSACQGVSLQDGSGVAIPPGVYFRVELAGITGHRQLASDCGILVRPEDGVAITAAMLRVFSEHGDRTDRKKARLKYLIDRWGTEKFLAETQAKLAFPLIAAGMENCEPRPAAVKHAHLGVRSQKQSGKNWVGIVVPVGMMSSAQMRGIAALAERHGSGTLRLTPWQNLIIPDVADADVTALRTGIEATGLHWRSSHVMGGLVACTGSRGCKYAAADTKGDAIRTGQWLEQQMQLDQPVNIHFTGCPHSCAQHYVGDLGLQAVKVERDGVSVDGYHIVAGGGTGVDSGIARPVRSSVAATEVPQVLEHILRKWQFERQPGESFITFTRRYSAEELVALFAP
jgi:ferredoxin-nitrite reductase